MSKPWTPSDAMQRWMDKEESIPVVTDYVRKPLPGEIVQEDGYVKIVDLNGELIILNGREIQALNDPNVLRALLRANLISHGEVVRLGKVSGIFLSAIWLRSFIAEFTTARNGNLDEATSTIATIQMLLDQTNRPGLIIAINDTLAINSFLNFSPEFEELYYQMTRGWDVNAPAGTMDALFFQRQATAEV